MKIIEWRDFVCPQCMSMLNIFRRESVYIGFHQENVSCMNAGKEFIVPFGEPIEVVELGKRDAD